MVWKGVYREQGRVCDRSDAADNCSGTDYCGVLILDDAPGQFHPALFDSNPNRFG